MAATTTTGKLAIRPLTPARWSDLEAIFQAKGCSIARGCWCMFYRQRGNPPVPAGMTRGQDAKQRLRALAGKEPAAGLIAYQGKTPVGWVTLGPRQDFVKLQHSPVMKPVDDQPVWSIVCFVVPSEHRRKGVAKALLVGAIAYARKKGAKIVEAYPVDKRGERDPQWLWHGTKAMYDQAGFHEVARRKAQRPIVRLDLAAPRQAERG